MNTPSANVPFAIWNPYRSAMPPQEEYERYLQSVEEALTDHDIDLRAKKLRAANDRWELQLIQHARYAVA
jgi:hypothetical protein